MKMKTLYNWSRTVWRAGVKVVRTHPIMTALGVIGAYFVTLQLPFLINGDIWAEAYMEYLTKALHSGWELVAAPSWEGYVTLLPSFFTTSYVSLHGPLGAVDVYFRLVAILFTTGSLALIASKLTAPLWPKLWQRLVVIVFLLVLLGHVSAFSFINVWYIGFVPIIAVSLAAVRMKVWQQILYTLFGVAVVFTKPSILLAPFVIYRAIKTKEYISSGVLLLASLVQTYLLFFATSNGERHIAADVLGIIKVMYIGVGAEVLKLIHVAPDNWLVLLANLAVITLFGLLLWRRGPIIAALIGFGLLLTVYSYALPPDPTLNVYTITPAQIFEDIYKLQREILIGSFLVLLCGLLLSDAAVVLARFSKNKHLNIALGTILLVLAGALVYRPIDVKSGSVAVDITPFRSNLTQGEPVCMPIAPMPTWSLGTNWYFAYKGGCEFTTLSKLPQLALMKEAVNGQTPIVLEGRPHYNLMSIVVPVYVPSPHHRQLFHLTDEQTGAVFSSAVLSSSQGGDIQFVAFNVHGLAEQSTYRFRLASEGQAYVAVDESLRSYGYFMLLTR